MSHKNKALLLAIDQVNNNLLLAQREKQQHRLYFSHLLSTHPALLLAVVLPPFFAGWKSGRSARAGNKLKQAAKFGFATAFKLARNYSLSII